MFERNNETELSCLFHAILISVNYTKAQFERRTFHVPKIIEIGRPKWYKLDVFFFQPWNLISRIQFSFTMYKGLICLLVEKDYINLCIRLRTWKVPLLNWA